MLGALTCAVCARTFYKSSGKTFCETSQRCERRRGATADLKFNSSFCVLIMTFVACRTDVARCNKLMIKSSYSINFRIDISEWVSVLFRRHASLTLSCHFISRLIGQVKSEISLEISAAFFFDTTNSDLIRLVMESFNILIWLTATHTYIFCVFRWD